MIEMFIAVFMVLEAGQEIGEFRSPEPSSHEECEKTLANDKPALLKMMDAHGYDNVELVGRCEPVGDPA